MNFLFIFLQLWLNFSPLEMQEVRNRSTKGPYKSSGDASPNSPGDWDRVVNFSEQVRNQPITAGNSASESVSIWSGYTGIPGPFNETFPVWQGIKPLATALRYQVLLPDTQAANPHGRKAKALLLAQMAVAKADITTWPSNTNYETGFIQGHVLTRWLRVFDFTSKLYSATEANMLNAWFSRQAYWLANQVHNEMARSFPNRRSGDYVTRIYYANPAGIASLAPFSIFPKADPLYGWAEDKLQYTHRNSDGTLGNKLPYLTSTFNNRACDKMHFVGLVGVLLGDQFLIDEAKRFAKEWLMFSVFPDGTIGEFQRNNYYKNPSQGAWYGWIMIDFYSTLADALARRNDYDLYEYETTDGAFGTEGGTKNFFLVLNRFAKYATGENPLYVGAVAANNRIDYYNENNGVYNPLDYLLAMPNKFYKSDYFTGIYTRRNQAVSKYPATKLATAGKSWLIWGGAQATQPAYLLMYGQNEDLETYRRNPPPLSIGLSDTTIVHGSRNFVLRAQLSAPAGLRSVVWRQLTGQRLLFEPFNQAVTVVSNYNYLEPIPIGEYYFKITAKDANGTRVDKTLKLTIEP